MNTKTYIVRALVPYLVDGKKVEKVEVSVYETISYAADALTYHRQHGVKHENIELIELEGLTARIIEPEERV